MTDKNRKQFGVWMDSHNATVVGKEVIDSGAFTILGHVKSNGSEHNSNEKNSNNQEIASTHKFFKEIAAIIPNVDQIHITGTGQIQEQFMKFLSDTPQYKNVQSTESTSNRMSDEQLVVFIQKHFN